MADQSVDELRQRSMELERERERERAEDRDNNARLEEIQRQLQQQNSEFQRQLQQQKHEFQRQLEVQKQETQRQLEERNEEYQRQLEERIQESQRQMGVQKQETRKATLYEYLEYCHEHRFKTIQAQTSKSQSNHGKPSNAAGKKRPDFIQPWKDFIETQKATLEVLFSKYQPYEAVEAFESLNHLRCLDERIALRRLASGLDLHTAIRGAVEDPLTFIVEHLQTHVDVRDAFQLPNKLWFDNHLNTLSDYGELASEQPDAPQMQPSTPPQSTSISSCCQPDQVCVYSTVDGLQKPVMIAEFIPPHKLTLDALRQVLDPDGPEIDLHNIINQVKTSSGYMVELIVAAVLCQAFLCMVTSGVLYGYITTGEAFVFLHNKVGEKCKRFYYYLAEPGSDVEIQRESFPEARSYLHRTALCQLLAFDGAVGNDSLCSAYLRHCPLF